MYSADFVTVLEDGRVLHNQVSPDRLDRALIGSIERTSSSSAAGDVGLGEGGSGGPSSAGGSAGSPAQQDDSQLDLKRATGDVSLYKFYFKSIGWVFSLSYIALAIIWQVLEKFGGRTATYLVQVL